MPVWSTYGGLLLVVLDVNVDKVHHLVVLGPVVGKVLKNLYYQ